MSWRDYIRDEEEKKKYNTQNLRAKEPEIATPKMAEGSMPLSKSGRSVEEIRARQAEIDELYNARKKREEQRKAEQEKSMWQRAKDKADKVIYGLDNTSGFDIWAKWANKTAEFTENAMYTEAQQQAYDKAMQEEQQRVQSRKEWAKGKGLLAKAGVFARNKVDEAFRRPEAFYDVEGDGKFGIRDLANLQTAIPKTAVSTATNLGTRAIGTYADQGKAYQDIFGYGASAVADLAGDKEASERWKKATQQEAESQKKFKEGLNKIGDEGSSLGKTGKNIWEAMVYSQSLGLSGGAGDANLLATGLGNSLEDSYSKDDVEHWQAWLKGGGDAYIGYLTEKINDAFGFGGSGISNTVKAKIMNKLESGTAKFLARINLGGFFESEEEVIEGVLKAKWADAVNFVTDLVGHGAKFDSNIDLEDLAEDAFVAYFSGEAGSTSSYNSRGIDVETVVKELTDNMKNQGYEVTNNDIKEFKNIALTARENAIAEDYQYASREEAIDKSKLSNAQKNQLLTAVRQNDTNAKELKKQIKEVGNTNREVEKRLEENNVSEEQKQTLLQMTNKDIDNKEMLEITDQVINENRKVDSEVNKQIQEIDNSKNKQETFENIINRNQRLLASQKSSLIQRVESGEITDYEALKEVRNLEAENKQEREARKELESQQAQTEIINELNSKKTTHLPINEKLVAQSKNALLNTNTSEKQATTMENKAVSVEEQQTTQEDTKVAQNETTQKIQGILDKNNLKDEKTLDNMIKSTEKMLKEGKRKQGNVRSNTRKVERR